MGTRHSAIDCTTLPWGMRRASYPEHLSLSYEMVLRASLSPPWPATRPTGLGVTWVETDQVLDCNAAIEGDAAKLLRLLIHFVMLFLLVPNVPRLLPLNSS